MARKKIILTHIVFWTLFILIGIIMNVALHNNIHVTWSLFWKDFTDPFTPIGYGRTIVVCYFSLYVFGKLIHGKNYTVAAASVIVMIGVDVLLRYLIEQKFLGPVFGKWQFPENTTFGPYFTENLFFSAMGIFICFLLKIIDDLYRNEVMEKEKNAMELQFLKSQINPHFLFNTFNNLYGLSLSDPQKTPDAILKLSEMMRYVLYESNEEKVSLKKEITYLQHMVSLQELRYDEQTYINFDIAGNMESYFIAPLLLISFVENAFKHGDMMDKKVPLVISIHLKDGKLLFNLRNKIAYKNKDHVGGIGLQNVKRRLDLLYHNAYKLEIKNDNTIFESSLTVNLN